MSRSRFHEVKSVFQKALEIAPERRTEFCRQHCDDETFEDVMSLITSHEEASTFLESPLENETESYQSDQDRWIGKAINDFHLHDVLGTGGHATVYRATQQHPHREVAFKLMHRRPTDPVAIHRFRDESNILAQLDHPGIGRVYASGQFDDLGEPRHWFAMELLSGQPLDQHVAARSLTVHQRIELVRDICFAVAHAHQQGVVHRDLKPSNIIVTLGESDDSARPVIVDFGIARTDVEHVNGARAKDRMQTECGTMLGTFSHMSPEQLTGDIDLVSAPADVYALGVIGYELLAGHPPLDMTRGSLHEVIQRGINEAPIPLGKIDRKFKGDLEAIFTTALEKSPQRRYVSAAAMGKDLDDFLHHRTVSVKTPSVVTKSVRFANRHRGFVTAATTILAVSIAGLLFYSDAAKTAQLEAKNARYEADKANAVNSFVTNDIMTNLVNGISNPNGDAREQVKQILTMSSKKVPGMFGDRPVIEAAIRNEIGTMHYNVGYFSEALQEYETAQQLWRSALGEQHPDTLKSCNNVALCLMQLGDGDRAESLLRETLLRRESVLGPDDQQTLATMNNLAQLLSDSGRLTEAEQLFSKAYQTQLNLAGFEDKQSLILAANLGTLMIRLGNHEQALDLHRNAFEGCCRELGEQHVTSRLAGFRYAQTLHQLGHFQTAARVLGPIVALTSHSASMECLNDLRLLARIQRDLADTDAATETLKHALAIANSAPEQFESAIRKIKRDLSRLE